jgi:hypothetical protein
MKIQKLLAILLVVPFPFFLTSHPASAINLVYTNFPTSFDYQPTASYKTTVDNDGLLTRDYLRNISPPSTKSAFWNVLTSSFSTWDFRRSGVPVYGDFLIDEYKVCPPISTCARLGGSVGAKLDLDYRPNFTFSPNTRQPNPDKGRVRWIQWVRSNHSLNPDKHGNKESVIDIDYEKPGNGTPFYYANSDLGNANSIYKFIDAPARVDIGQNHDWIADLYLTEEITKPGSNIRKVLIYGGVRWGWHNRVIEKKKEPLPGTCQNPNNSSGSSGGGGCPPPPPPPSCNGGSGGGGCNRNVVTDQTDYQELSSFDSNDANSLQYQYEDLSFLDIDYTNLLTQEEYLSYFGMDDPHWWTEDEDQSDYDINDPTWWTEEQDRLYFNENYGYNNSESPASVPESTPALGLLALGAWGIIKAIKIRLEK